MTDIRDQIDLDEYAQLLADLEKEIREYGKQRKSLQDIVKALKDLNASSASAIGRAEKTIATGEDLFTKLDELHLPDQIASLRARYDEHQQSLTDVTAKMQQIVQEQQRSSLETLQNAQHTRESLERIASEAKRAAEGHDVIVAGVSEQIRTLSTQLLDHAETVSATLGTHAASLADLQRQLAVTRMVATIALVLLVIVVALTIFSVM